MDVHRSSWASYGHQIGRYRLVPRPFTCAFSLSLPSSVRSRRLLITYKAGRQVGCVCVRQEPGARDAVDESTYVLPR